MEGGGVGEWDSGSGEGGGREGLERGEGVKCTHHSLASIICGHVWLFALDEVQTDGLGLLGSACVKGLNRGHYRCPNPSIVDYNVILMYYLFLDVS